MSDFADAVEFIFTSRESRAGGSEIGGAQLLDLLVDHLVLSGTALALGVAVDAARGMGMTGGEIVRHVELPFATPLVMGGIRTSAVNVVATATIAPLAGVSSLGDPIIAYGVYGDAGRLGASIVVALVAVGSECGFAGVQRLLSPVRIDSPSLQEAP